MYFSRLWRRVVSACVKCRGFGVCVGVVCIFLLVADLISFSSRSRVLIMQASGISILDLQAALSLYIAPIQVNIEGAKTAM